MAELCGLRLGPSEGFIIERMRRALLLFAVLAIGCTTFPDSAEDESSINARMRSGVEFSVPSGGATLRTWKVGGHTGGPALVAIHGGPGFSSEYLRTLEPLASRDFQVVTYDQQGVGGSTLSKDFDYSLGAYVSDLEAVRVALGVDRIHLLGSSWGGLIAMGYAIAHPNRTASLLLVGSVPPTQEGWDAGSVRAGAKIAALQASGHIPDPLPKPNGDDCMPTARAYAPVYFHDPAFAPPPEFLAVSCHAGIQAATLHKIRPYDLRSNLATLRTPTLVFFGAADPFGTAWADEIVGALAAANPERVVLPETGHVPWFERPGASFATMRDFLAKHGGGTLHAPPTP
jgi:proline iminopeptidase